MYNKLVSTSLLCALFATNVAFGMKNPEQQLYLAVNFANGGNEQSGVTNKQSWQFFDQDGIPVVGIIVAENKYTINTNYNLEYNKDTQEIRVNKTDASLADLQLSEEQRKKALAFIQSNKAKVYLETSRTVTKPSISPRRNANANNTNDSVSANNNFTTFAEAVEALLPQDEWLTRNDSGTIKPIGDISHSSMTSSPTIDSISVKSTGSHRVGPEDNKKPSSSYTKKHYVIACGISIAAIIGAYLASPEKFAQLLESLKNMLSINNIPVNGSCA